MWNRKRNDEPDPVEAPAAKPVLVARQPIFDRALQVVAYELLYRSEGADRAHILDAWQATAEVLAGATLDIGLARLVGDCPAYINFPADMLAAALQPPLGPDRIVIEVLEGAIPDARLLAGLTRLRAGGYRIALDDFDLRKESAVLLDYADIVKVDIQQHSPVDLASSVRVLERPGLQLVAEKVETAAELARCRDLGFQLFQGYFLQRPEIFSERRAPSSRLAALQLILSLDDPDVSAEHVEACIARDVGLSYRLLRCINSSYYRRPRQVDSIRKAVLLLGFSELRKICSVILLAELNDRPAYVSVQALARARMCESLCVTAGLAGGDAYFMTGLLSLLDVFLGMPLAEALLVLPLNEPIREALLEHRGSLGAALRCALNYERGEWHAVEFNGLTPADIAAAYDTAIGWADGTRAALKAG